MDDQRQEDQQVTIYSSFVPIQDVPGAMDERDGLGVRGQGDPSWRHGMMMMMIASYDHKSDNKHVICL